ncbi:Similar to Trx-2: Thioredoxin-2 (Drosophila yakuba) [Cotesia congregata]|uniref:Similar to Trx-2: Thioredoxin-2 (Drosophila yakuba) n=1 Tax=Cotesia congregata TaxID=51543 RepID=A0A8J2HC33_COTCN|nr:Similar to Trx-2: Thioredoxin-2 (Drosophila yakuba) [Cotesia congregata]
MSSYYFEKSTFVMKVLIILLLIIAVSSMAFAGSDDLKSKIAAGDNKLIVLDFYATWCDTCGMIGPKFDELAALHRDVTFIKIDCDKNESIADQYKITKLPTFIFIKNNKEY